MGMLTGGIGDGYVFEEEACSAGLAIECYPDQQDFVHCKSCRRLIYVLYFIVAQIYVVNFIKRSDKPNEVRQKINGPILGCRFASRASPPQQSHPPVLSPRKDSI